MGISFLNLKLHQEFDRIKVLQMAHFFFLAIALLIEWYLAEGTAYTILKLFVLLGGYKFYYQSVKNLYYTFWTISAFVMSYILYGVFEAYVVYDSLSLIYCYLFALGFLLSQLYILFSPIYYPIVRWWEYDFRFRDDLKITVCDKDKKIEARLTDLRKKAGCVVMFNNYNVGDHFDIDYDDEKAGHKFHVEIMSKFQYSLGRPPRYGVKFICKNKASEEDFKNFSRFWNLERKYKNLLKFKTSNS